MTRFLMLLAVAAVAGAMYVAAAPGSAQHAGPTWKQFTALQKQLSALKTQFKQVKAAAIDADGFIHACLLTNAAGVAPVTLAGDITDLQANTPQTYGFHFLPSVGGAEGFSTALNIDTSASPLVWFQAVDPACVNPAGAAHASGHMVLRSETAR